MKPFIFTLLTLILGISTHAGEITSLNDPSHSLSSIENGNSTFRPVKYCKIGQCELIPNQDILLLQEFSQNDLSWKQVFNQCNNYQSLNQLTTWTQILSSLVVAIKPISVLRNLRSTKNLLASWGLFGRVVGHRIVFDTGINVAGQMIYSIPAQLIESESPYPEIEPADVELVANLLEEVISDTPDIYYLPAEMIDGIALILKGCTSQLKQESITSNAQKCLTDCHSSKKTKTYKKSKKAPHLNSPADSSLIKFDLDLEKLQEHLNQ